MKAVLLAPHNDDETLFASYLALRHQPDIVVCFMGHVQEQYGVTGSERMEETRAAAEILGCSFEQWPFPDLDPDRAELADLFSRIVSLALTYDLCIAPAVEAHGHEQHNIVGEYARETFGPTRVIRYLTYTSHGGGGRSRDGVLVEPDRFEWIGLKLQALACYRSQLRVNNCRPWFYDQLDVREWVADY